MVNKFLSSWIYKQQLNKKWSSSSTICSSNRTSRLSLVHYTGLSLYICKGCALILSLVVGLLSKGRGSSTLPILKFSLINIHSKLPCWVPEFTLPALHIATDRQYIVPVLTTPKSWIHTCGNPEDILDTFYILEGFRFSKSISIFNQVWNIPISGYSEPISLISAIFLFCYLPSSP